jgi:hypothetical protein
MSHLGLSREKVGVMATGELTISKTQMLGPKQAGFPSTGSAAAAATLPPGRLTCTPAPHQDTHQQMSPATTAVQVT